MYVSFTRSAADKDQHVLSVSSKNMTTMLYLASKEVTDLLNQLKEAGF